MQELQPKMRELQERFKDDKEKLAQEQMKLYREHGVNPLGGCLPLLIQFPILIGLYRAIVELANTDPNFARPFLWLKSLAEPEPLPYILIILMVISQFLYQKLLTPPAADPQQQSMNRVMQFMPLMFAFIFINLPAGLVLYYLVFNLVSIVQQVAINQWTDLRAAPAVATAGNPDTAGKKAAKPGTVEERKRKRLVATSNPGSTGKKTPKRGSVDDKRRKRRRRSQRG
jgi:YidC/Oxa1 family membrane protein insertase